jgi:hypothetical protein
MPPFLHKQVPTLQQLMYDKQLLNFLVSRHDPRRVVTRTKNPISFNFPNVRIDRFAG